MKKIALFTTLLVSTAFAVPAFADNHHHTTYYPANSYQNTQSNHVHTTHATHVNYNNGNANGKQNHKHKHPSHQPQSQQLHSQQLHSQGYQVKTVNGKQYYATNQPIAPHHGYNTAQIKKWPVPTTPNNNPNHRPMMMGQHH